jgi:hypothetical protein
MNSSKKYLVSFFDNLKNIKPIENIDIHELFISIKNGKWKSDIEKCQIDVTRKKELPCFTPTGIFKQRNSQGIENYSGIICLDIDHIENPEKLKNLCKSIPWVWVAFITPSGKGLKVFAQTTPELTQFQILEAKIARAFFDETGQLRDEKCKDLARLQFVSFDPDIYYNQNPEIFK